MKKRSPAVLIVGKEIVLGAEWDKASKPVVMARKSLKKPMLRAGEDVDLLLKG